MQHAYLNGLTTNKGGSHGFAVGVIDNQIGKRFETLKDWAETRGIVYSTARNLLSNKSKRKKKHGTIDLEAIVKIIKRQNDEQYPTRG